MALLFPITYKCNLSCRFCSMKDSRREPVIDKCIKLIKSSKNDWVWLTGGEPLMVENIEKICLTIKSFGKKIGITTNGTINNERLPLFADRVGVSIDGDEKYHNEYRQGTYKKAVEFLSKLVGKVETVFMFTLFPENEHCLAFIENLSNKLNVDYLQITKAK
ncbi:MAG TPA: radical SAM protein [Bacteroidales bacterium]|nr:radical SAM protein [Bacteroidales bacterium]